MRTFHIGGAASRAAAIDNITVKTTGTVKFNNLKHVQHANGHLVAVSRSGELSVLDDHGRERERYKLPYGAVINVKDGASIKAGQTVANWDPHNHPIVSEVAGFVRFIDFVDGITVIEKTDELTGLASREITDPKRRGSMGKDLRPIVRIVEPSGKDLNIPGTDLPAQYLLPPRSIVNLQDGAAGRRGRRGHQDAAGSLEDPRHHRWSAARGRPVRSAQAEGSGDPGRASRASSASARTPRASSA